MRRTTKRYGDESVPVTCLMILGRPRDRAMVLTAAFQLDEVAEGGDAAYAAGGVHTAGSVGAWVPLRISLISCGCPSAKGTNQTKGMPLREA